MDKRIARRAWARGENASDGRGRDDETVARRRGAAAGTTITIIGGLMLGGCGEAREAARVELPVMVGGDAPAAVTTDLGYRVELRAAQIAIRDLVFTVAGEVDVVSSLEWVSDLWLPEAHAHPGHFQGGEVTGELRGRFAADWSSEDARLIGRATLVTGTYTAANFTFDRGELGSSDQASADADLDALVGHTAVVHGRAERDGMGLDFTIVVNAPVDRALVGAPFEATLGPDAQGWLALEFLPFDDAEADTVFDGIDFAALDDDADGHLRIEPDVPEREAAYHRFRRAFQTHDHFRVRYVEDER